MQKKIVPFPAQKPAPEPRVQVVHFLEDEIDQRKRVEARRLHAIRKGDPRLIARWSLRLLEINRSIFNFEGVRLAM